MEANKVAVVGAGTMGHGIAQVASMAGFHVYIRDTESRILDDAMEKIRNSLARFVKKGNISEEAFQDIANRIEPTTDLREAVGDADYIIEAVPEILELKKKLFSEMDVLAAPHAILLHNLELRQSHRPQTGGTESLALIFSIPLY